MARIAIIVGHARHNSYCEALGRAYQRGAQAGGHEAVLFVTSAMTFDPLLHEGFERVQPLEHDLEVAHDVMLKADHLVIIFPLWLGTLPAILKGFLSVCCSRNLSKPQNRAGS
jgi:NAD(P)H dehydrogenase (quinone)